MSYYGERVEETRETLDPEGDVMDTTTTRPTADDIRAEVQALLQVLIDLADYTRGDLIDIVDDALAAEGKTE